MVKAKPISDAFSSDFSSTSPFSKPALGMTGLSSIQAIQQGFENKEIADKLSISIETVTWHLRHIYSKLHVRSRTQAALKFLGRKKNP